MEITKDILNKVKALGNVVYYLYEIVGVKVGVTQNLTQRQKHQKDKGELIVLGEYTDIFKVSEIERELQAEKGYHIDKHPYWYTVLVQNPKSCTPEAIAKQVANTDFRKAAIGSTRKLTEEEVIEARKRYSEDVTLSAADLGKEYNVSVQTMITALNGTKYSEIPGAVEIRDARVKCKYCDTVSTVTNIGRWHNDNCKNNPNYVSPERQGKVKYKELTSGETKYLFEWAEQYNVAIASIIYNSKVSIPGKRGVLKGLNFIKL